MESRFLMLLVGLFLILSCQVQDKIEVNRNDGPNSDSKLNLIRSFNLEKLTSRSNEDLEIKVTKDTLSDLPVYHFITDKQPRFIFSYSVGLPLKKESFSKGEKLLLQFRAKTVGAAYAESGEGKLKFIFATSKNRKKWHHKIISISREWNNYYIPVEILESLGKGTLKIVMQFGFPPQYVSISDMKLFKYDTRIHLDSLPKTNVRYGGMNADASWREEAKHRIEQYRKGDFTLIFRKDGKIIKGARVSLELKKHHFRWGATIKAKNLVTIPQYRENLVKYFNQVTFANDLKIKHWKKWKDYTEQAFVLLEADQIPVKGHVLIWPGFRHLTPYFEKNKNNPLALQKKMNEHLDEILNFTRGRVDRWDVTNETYTNNDLQTILGSEEILYEGFRKLHEKEPEVLRFTNEFAIISRGGIYKEKQEWYKDYIRRIDENTGGLVDGIGIQCHMGSAPTSIERVYEILEDFEELGKMICISEFTMAVDDPEVRYLYTKDFLTIAFSHPAVQEFVFWGMNERDNWKVDLFTENWELGSMGKAFTELVHDEWKTSIAGELSDQGSFSGSGFYGDYGYKIILNGQIITGGFKMLPDSNPKIVIDL